MRVKHIKYLVLSFPSYKQQVQLVYNGLTHVKIRNMRERICGIFNFDHTQDQNWEYRYVGHKGQTL